MHLRAKNYSAEKKAGNVVPWTLIACLYEIIPYLECAWKMARNRTGKLLPLLQTIIHDDNKNRQNTKGCGY